MKTALPLDGSESRKQIKNFRQHAKKRATMQGFADRSKQSKMTVVVLGSLTTYSR
jgi:hypothetical protein